MEWRDAHGREGGGLLAPANGTGGGHALSTEARTASQRAGFPVPRLRRPGRRLLLPRRHIYRRLRSRHRSRPAPGSRPDSPCSARPSS